MVLTWLDVALLVDEAGWSSRDAQVAIALTQPESGRRTDAANRQRYASTPLAGWTEAEKNFRRDPLTGLYWVSGDPNGGSFGPLQVNGIHDPSHGGQHPHAKPTDAWVAKMLADDGLANFKAGYQVWQTSGFEAWGAFTAGKHTPYLVTAAAVMYAREVVQRLRADVAARDAKIAGLEELIRGRDLRIAELEDTVDAYAAQVAEEERLKAKIAAALPLVDELLQDVVAVQNTLTTT